MSFHALSWAVRQKLPGMQKLVLLMLSERHNKDTGQCNPSLELLAEDCGLSRRSVIDQISKLQAAGYLTVIHRAKESVRLPSQYVLHLGFGVRETEKTIPDDPYILPNGVVNDVHQGSECPALGVVNDVHQGSECPALGVVNDVHQGSAPRAHRTRNRTRNIEPGIEPKKINKENSLRVLMSDVTDQTINDFMQLRKTKKAPLTQRAIEGIRKEAMKAGISLENALIECCTRGWVGFKAEWYKQSLAPAARASPAREKSKTFSAFDYSRGGDGYGNKREEGRIFEGQLASGQLGFQGESSD